MKLYETVIIQATADDRWHILDEHRIVAATSPGHARVIALRENPPPAEVPSEEIHVMIREYAALS